MLIKAGFVIDEVKRTTSFGRIYLFLIMFFETLP